jgi:hypothetical protein
MMHRRLDCVLALLGFTHARLLITALQVCSETYDTLLSDRLLALPPIEHRTGHLCFDLI